MDLDKVIRELHQELKRIEVVIKSLEEWLGTGAFPSRSHRGRKSMAEEERLLVSKRMKKYWANRRKRSS
jgi:hypothetical protein